jgi:hypothetical protein
MTETALRATSQMESDLTKLKIVGLLTAILGNRLDPEPRQELDIVSPVRGTRRWLRAHFSHLAG